MDGSVPYLVRDELGAVGVRSRRLARDRSALVVEKRPRPFECGVSRREPHKVKFEGLNRSRDERERL